MVFLVGNKVGVDGKKGSDELDGRRVTSGEFATRSFRTEMGGQKDHRAFSADRLTLLARGRRVDFEFV